MSLRELELGSQQRSWLEVVEVVERRSIAPFGIQ
jgi:hypothetical protein